MEKWNHFVQSVEKIKKVKTWKPKKRKNNLSLKCAVCDSKKSRFSKKQEASDYYMAYK